MVSITDLLTNVLSDLPVLILEFANGVLSTRECLEPKGTRSITVAVGVNFPSNKNVAAYDPDCEALHSSVWETHKPPKRLYEFAHAKQTRLTSDPFPEIVECISNCYFQWSAFSSTNAFHFLNVHFKLVLKSSFNLSDRVWQTSTSSGPNSFSSAIHPFAQIHTIPFGSPKIQLDNQSNGFIFETIVTLVSRKSLHAFISNDGLSRNQVRSMHIEDTMLPVKGAIGFLISMHLISSRGTNHSKFFSGILGDWHGSSQLASLVSNVEMQGDGQDSTWVHSDLSQCVRYAIKRGLDCKSSGIAQTASQPKQHRKNSPRRLQ